MHLLKKINYKLLLLALIIYYKENKEHFEDKIYTDSLYEIINPFSQYFIY
jgi:hypothetical protein